MYDISKVTAHERIQYLYYEISNYIQKHSHLRKKLRVDEKERNILETFYYN
jgi:hypothetical protein